MFNIKVGNRPKECDDCQGMCLRTVGGALTCACRDGFQLAENKKDCVEVKDYVAPFSCRTTQPKVNLIFCRPQPSKLRYFASRPFSATATIAAFPTRLCVMGEKIVRMVQMRAQK